MTENESLKNQENRLDLLTKWLGETIDQQPEKLVPASADASFRRYYRVTYPDNSTYIVMDAPPDKEDCETFIRITELLRDVKVNAPEVIHKNIEHGFILLSDLGDQLYLDELSDNNSSSLYSDAVSTLIKMQSIKATLPVYDTKRLREEMELFETWYLNKHLNIQLDKKQKSDLEKTLTTLVNNALEQPQVFVHRDYHSRNLMFTKDNNPGVIDYQDAVIGPVTYDLVSLYKDCYIKWPREKIHEWVIEYILLLNMDVEQQQFIEWFDLMGVQRHLKVLGIFSRLYYRDGKKQYLNDLPLTLEYVTETCELYNVLEPLKNLLQQIAIKDNRPV